ncbi:C-type lectin domain family 12 member B-like [Carassius carassius]|uniref:C-type lectin domain family 12 member B-like n=1 Tax=Carassius carassius TaxID=217509 RepID=UPI002868BBF7|nr:C-type lectin domain family 12 member B-like [Carassius carassius]
MFESERSDSPDAIYINVDSARRLDLRITEKQQPLQHTENVSVKNRKHRAAGVCLCLVCFLLLTAVIVLCVCYTSERKQLLTQISNLTEERVQIMERNKNLTEERVQIMECNNNLTEESKQLMNDKNRLDSWLYKQDQQGEPLKWIYYNFSFYYISSEKKSWSDSRRDCQQRGADLVIIKEASEKKFLLKVVEKNYFWIGLINTESGWIWIDDTKTPTGSGTANCAAFRVSDNYRFHCDTTHRWICERPLKN